MGNPTEEWTKGRVLRDAFGLYRGRFLDLTVLSLPAVLALGASCSFGGAPIWLLSLCAYYFSYALLIWRVSSILGIAGTGGPVRVLAGAFSVSAGLAGQ